MAAITTLSLRRVLHTRASILSGVTAPQACNRDFRNLATVVGRLSISQINCPIWSQICSMGFGSGLRAGHCMTSTPLLMWEKWQNFFGKLPLPREGDFGARWQYSVAGWPCHPPSPAPICPMHGKPPILWGRGSHFHLFLGCNSPLVSQTRRQTRARPSQW